jgi:hypothetical protein
MDPLTVPSREQPSRTPPPHSRAPSRVLGARSTSHADAAPPPIENGGEAAAYAAYWEELLRREYREAADSLRQRRSKWPRARLESSGLCLFDACATPDEELYGEKVVRVSKPGETRMADRFNRGDILVLSPDRRSLFGESAEFVPRECCVVDTGKDWLTVGVGLRWQTSGMKCLLIDPGLPLSFHTHRHPSALLAVTVGQRACGRRADVLVPSGCCSSARRRKEHSKHSWRRSKWYARDPLARPPRCSRWTRRVSAKAPLASLPASWCSARALCRAREQRISRAWQVARSPLARLHLIFRDLP